MAGRSLLGSRLPCHTPTQHRDANFEIAFCGILHQLFHVVLLGFGLKLLAVLPASENHRQNAQHQHS